MCVDNRVSKNNSYVDFMSSVEIQIVAYEDTSLFIFKEKIFLMKKKDRFYSKIFWIIYEFPVVDNTNNVTVAV